jgi:hypothetical protein
MNVSYRRIACATAAAGALAGCGIAAQTAGAPTAGEFPAAQPSHATSWLTPLAKKSSYLLYVQSSNSGTVDLYDFKSQKQLGSTSSLDEWLCSDKRGDVYGGDHSYYGGSKITEFGAGTLKVIKTLSDDAGYPVGCSVNPKNGDLAVTNYYNEEHDGYGGVLIYKGGSGSPTEYYGPDLEWPAGYDPNGNLFVEGEDGMDGDCGSICLAELPYGGTSFEVLSFSQQIYSPAAVQWDGKYLGVGDQDVDGDSTSGIYETSVSGSSATVVRTVKFAGPGSTDVDFTQWADYSSKPNDVPGKLATQLLGVWTPAYGSTRLYEWAYPAGGAPSRQFITQLYPAAAVLVRVR